MALPAGVTAVFPFRPDWSDPVEESYSYKTNVLRSRDRTGQWRGLRSKPREQMVYSALLGDDQAASFDYRMGAVQPYVWLLPQWTRGRRLTADVSSGGTTLVLDGPVSYLSRAGDEWVLISDGLEPEAVTLDSVSGDRLTLTLAAALEDDWPARAEVYPAWRAVVSGEFTASWLSGRVMSCPVTFRRLVDDRVPGVSTLTQDVEIGGLEALVRPIDWSNPVEVTYSWVPEILDADVGPFETEVRGAFSSRMRKGDVLVDGRDELDWWLAFFDRRRGQRVPFLMPTWLGDLQLQQPLSPGFDFEVPGTDLGRFAPPAGVYTHLMVRKNDGTLAFFTVDTVDPDFTLGVSTVTTVEAWDEAYGPWECSQVSFVTVCHLAGDSLSVRWITDEVARLTISVSTEEIPA